MYKYADWLSGKALRYQKAQGPAQPGVTEDLKTVRLTRLSLSSAALYRFNICSLLGEKGSVSFFCAGNTPPYPKRMNKRNNSLGFITKIKFYQVNLLILIFP
jgi:hypothetical protein